MIEYIVLGSLAIILTWRIILPGMKLSSEKATVNTESKGSPAVLSDVKKRVMAHMPSILIAIVGAVLVYWGFQNTQVGPSDAGSWGRNHWLSLLIFWGFGAALVALNAPEKAKASLHWVLAGVMFMLFIGFPIIGWFGESKAPVGQKQTAAAPKVERPMLSVTVPANGYSEHIMPPVGFATDFRGHGYTIHCVYRDGTEGVVGDTTHPCKDGDMLYQYLRNTTGESNLVKYEFVPFR